MLDQIGQENFKIMHLYWTSKQPIGGLRHFVLVDQFEVEGRDFIVLVSVLDVEINITLSKNKFEKSNTWIKGWLKLKRTDAITNKYKELKNLVVKEKNKEIFINDNSYFDIS